ADAVAAAVETELGALATHAVARAAWDANGAIVVVDSLAAACPLVDRLAPEHLQLSVEDPDALFARIRHAGSVFLGRHTPEAIG
ncbi:histidinol dehydrogenase, partial [Clostridium perfringens]